MKFKNELPGTKVLLNSKGHQPGWLENRLIMAITYYIGYLRCNSKDS